MNSNTHKFSLALTGLILCSSVSARLQNTYFDSAKVVDVEPIYESVQVDYPQEHCWDERVRYERPHRESYTGTIAGGIVGGVVGRQFGHGNTRRLFTLAGSLLGASVGNDLSHRGRHYESGYTRTERRCEVVNESRWEDQMVGYRVTYRYRGKEFVTRTQKHPGKRIRVRVGIEPGHGEAVTGSY